MDLRRHRGAIFGVGAVRYAGGADCAQQKVAAFLTMTAGLCADAAMLMHAAVLLAFVATQLAGQDACMELGVHELIGSFRLPGKHSGRRVTNIGAIQIRADAAAKLFEVLLFAKTSVRARRARGGA